jgi:hypothetical protein
MPVTKIVQNWLKVGKQFGPTLYNFRLWMPVDCAAQWQCGARPLGLEGRVDGALAVDQLARPADSVEEVGVGDGGALLVRARC